MGSGAGRTRHGYRADFDFFDAAAPYHFRHYSGLCEGVIYRRGNAVRQRQRCDDTGLTSIFFTFLFNILGGSACIFPYILKSFHYQPKGCTTSRGHRVQGGMSDEKRVTYGYDHSIGDQRDGRLQHVEQRHVEQQHNTGGSENTAANLDAGSGDSGKPVTINIFQYKVEIADAMNRLKADYENEHPNVKLNIETMGGGADYSAGLKAKFAAGQEPDVFNNGGKAELTTWIDKLEDLSDQPWVSDVIDTAKEPISRDGQNVRHADRDRRLRLYLQQGSVRQSGHYGHASNV